jgi:hypothetical protein
MAIEIGSPAHVRPIACHTMLAEVLLQPMPSQATGVACAEHVKV